MTATRKIMQVVLTHIANHHRTHRHPLTIAGGTYSYGQDVVLEQYNGTMQDYTSATALARDLSRRQGGTGWCSVYDVPMLHSLDQAHQEGWDPSLPLRQHRTPRATFFAGCPVTWRMAEGLLETRDSECNFKLAPRGNSQWTAQLQAQLFPEQPFPHTGAPGMAGLEIAFGIHLAKSDSLLRQLRDNAVDLGIPHHTEDDLRELMQQYPEATTFEALVRAVGPHTQPDQALDQAEEDQAQEDQAQEDLAEEDQAEDQAEEEAQEDQAEEDLAEEDQAEEDQAEEDQAEEDQAEVTKKAAPKLSPELAAAAASVLTA